MKTPTDELIKMFDRQIAELRVTIADKDKENAAIRELMNCYNVGGWTDSIEPMKRALKAEAELAELRERMKPTGIGWQRSGLGWVCEVWQSAYGHRANKATWLYYRGRRKPPELRWERPIGTHQIGFHDQRGSEKNKPTLGKREANATPLAFRDELLRLALHSAT